MSTDVAAYQGEYHGFDTEQQSLLNEKLKEQNIKERPGAGGKKLKYVSGDYAIATANRIFGFGKWGYRVLSKSRESVSDKEFYTADIELYVIGCPFPFPGEGVGVPQNSTIEQHEKARKEAVTDALKRALRHYGDQFGLSLYNEDNYIEASDGTDKRVGDVGKPASAKPAPRVVDAIPPAQASGSAVPTVKELQKRCNDLCGAGAWQTMVHKALKMPISDGPILDKDMTIDYRQKTAAYLDYVQEQVVAKKTA